MTETVLVTGGTGFIAGWCIATLLARGYEVRTTVRDVAKADAVRAAVARAGQGSERLRVFAADLLADEGWDAAVAGCDYVLHVASPLGGGTPGDRYSLVPVSRDGTLRVLRAAVAAGVKRVVLTSAAATARPPLDDGRVSDETIWADPDDKQFDAYRVSKILAERAAWDCMAGAGGVTQLTTVLPGAVFGPMLSRDNLGSVEIIRRLLLGRPKALPRVGFWVVDVRDLAELHVTAMTSPAAAGERFIAAGEFMWMAEIAGVLRATAGIDASRVPRRQMPDWLVRLMLPLLPHLQLVVPLLGRKYRLDPGKARRVLGFGPRPARETIADCARSLAAFDTLGRM